MGDLQHHFIAVSSHGGRTETLEQLFEVDRFVGLFRHIQIKLNFSWQLLFGSCSPKMHVELRRVINRSPL